MAGSTSFAPNSVASVSNLLQTRKQPTKMSSSKKLSSSEEPAHQRKSSVFSIENLLAPSTSTRSSPVATPTSAFPTAEMVQQQLHYHQNFFSLHQNLLPALADPATYGYGYLGKRL